MNLKCYYLHLKITNNLNTYENELERDESIHNTDIYYQWITYNNKVSDIIRNRVHDKRKILNEKLKKLIRVRNNNESHATLKVEMLNNFVINESNETFNDKELQLLNHGLKFVPPSSNVPLKEICSDIEAGLHNLQFQRNSQDLVNRTRSVVDSIFSSYNLENTSDHHNNTRERIINNLRQKEVYYVKADKGNALVILDKNDYDNRMLDMLNSGPYSKKQGSRDELLKKLIKITNETLSRTCTILNISSTSLKYSNPKLAAIYGLPKIHKLGNDRKKLRPINSCTNYPTEKIAKWLVKEFSKLPKPNRRSVKNCFEFAKKVNGIKLEKGEILISFDVSALFPSIPVNETISHLRNWLLRNNVDAERTEALIDLTKLCVSNCFFTYKGEVYSQTSGLAMGSSLSPFLAELFMSVLEEDLSKRQFFPRLWFRYVDDIFCIIKKSHIRIFLRQLNEYHPSIKFTFEEEQNGKLPFLDVMVIRNSEDTIELDIYRKPTNTERFITQNSMHPEQHKMAAFNSMIHRLVTLPLNEERYKKEQDYIFQLATKNGFSKEIIRNLLRKKAMRAQNRRLTTLFDRREENMKSSIVVTFHPRVNSRLQNALRSLGINLINKTQTKLKDLLGNPKDKQRKLEKSGIYQIICESCEKIYVGQTRRSVKTRFDEHISKYRRRHYDSSAVATHMHINQHPRMKVSLLEQVSDPRKLDFLETLYINKADPDLLLNREGGPNNSVLLKYG